MAFRLMVWPSTLGSDDEHVRRFTARADAAERFDRVATPPWAEPLLAELARSIPGFGLDVGELAEWDEYEGPFRMGVVGEMLLALVPFEEIDDALDLADRAISHGLCVYAIEADALRRPGSERPRLDRERFVTDTSRAWDAAVREIDRVLEAQVVSGFDVLVTCPSVASADEAYRILLDEPDRPAASDLGSILRRIERAPGRLKSPPQISGCVLLIHVKDDWDWFVELVEFAQVRGLRTFDPASGEDIAIDGPTS